MANIFTFTDDYLNRLRNVVKNDISSVRYKAGNTWYTEPIQSAEVLSDGSVKIQFVISYVTGTITIIELYDVHGNKVGEKTVNIADVAGSGVYYMVQLSLFQITQNLAMLGTYDAIE